jgi:hypothetical protein
MSDTAEEVAQPLADFDERAAMFRKRLRGAPVAVFDKAVAAIDRERYRAIQKMQDGDASNKFCDVPLWLRVNALAVERMGLLERPPCRVLDIGSGGGQFLAICKALGHTTMGIDIPNPLYAALFDLYGIPRIEHAVKLGQPLPASVGRHEAIVATGVVFDYHWSADRKKTRWTVAEWASFLEDLTRDHMTFPGLLYLHINRGGRDNTNPFYTPVFELFEANGAEVEHERGRARFLLDEPLKFREVPVG